MGTNAVVWGCSMQALCILSFAFAWQAFASASSGDWGQAIVSGILSGILFVVVIGFVVGEIWGHISRERRIRALRCK